MLTKLISFTLWVCCVLFIPYSFSQQHTFTSFSPNNAATGEVVTLRGTNLTGVTAVRFGGTDAASFTVVNATTIVATVASGTSGSISVLKTGFTTRTLAGFNYSTIPTVTGIITDYGTFWNTNTTTTNPVLPDNSHNFLAFTFGGVTYSTGANDNALVTNGVNFNAGNFRALPVELVGRTAGGANLIMVGSKVDGNLTTALPTHPNIKDRTIQSNVMDGLKGLDIGTGYTNLPSGSSSNYFVTNINPDKIADNEPDLIVTQIAEPTGTATDTYRFLDASDNVVGNPVQISLSTISSLGRYRLDLFTVNANQAFDVGKPVAAWETNGTREIRLVAFRLSDMGITASNYHLIKKLNITPSGVSDVAFVAYNANAIDALPVVTVNTSVTNTVICGGGGAAQLGVTATTPDGGALNYTWEVSTDNGSSWNSISNGGIYSNTTTPTMNISSATSGYRYRCRVTVVSNGYYVYSPIFTITTATATPLSGTLNPTSFSNCINPTSGTTSLSISPSGGTGTYTYTWESSPTGSAPWTVVPGENSSSFTPNMSVAGEMHYRVSILSGCYTNTSTAAKVTINGANITSVTDASRCNSGTLTLGASADAGTISWFNVASGGTALTTGTSYTTPSLSSTTTYFVSTTSSGCTSPRTPVNAIIASSTTLNSGNFSVIFSSSVCSGSSSFVSLSSSNIVNGTYSVNYTISGANSFSGSSSLTFLDGYASFYTSSLTNIGSNTLTINSIVIGGCTVTITSGNTSTISVLGTTPNVSNFNVAVTDGCSNLNPTVTITSSSLTNGNYTIKYDVSGANSISNATAQISFNAGTGSFALTGLSVYGGFNTLTITEISFTSSSGCAASLLASSNNFEVNTATLLNSGNDVTICFTDSDANITNGASASNFQSLVWSTSGSGTFTNNTTPQALSDTRYTPSLADKSAGSVVLSITAIANTGCQNQVRSIFFYTSPSTVGGTVLGSSSVCTGTNSTTLTLSGRVGNILRWESCLLSDFSSGVNTIANTTNSLTVTNLSQTTYYRAVVQSGVCSTSNSSIATITVNSTSVGGTVTGGATVCSGTNSTLLTLSGHTGDIVRWESSPVTNFASGVVTISNTSTTYTVVDATSTLHYRAVVANGVCASANSARATVTVNVPAVGGSVSSNTTVCTGTNSTTLTLSGHTGSVTRWQWSTVSDFSSGVTNVSGTSTNLTVNNLTSSRYYRAQVTSGVCPTTFSSAALITVSPASVGGTASGSATVCSGVNSTTLSLAGNIGNITQWESSLVSDFSSGVNTISNTSSTLVVTNLTQTTYYRAVVTSGVCSSSNSTSATITVMPEPNAGVLTGSQDVCTLISTTITPSVSGGTWSSSNTGIATVNSSGVVTGISSGTATITYSVTGTGACSTVTNNATIDITVSPLLNTSGLTSGDYIWKGGNTGVETTDRDWTRVLNWAKFNGSALQEVGILPTVDDNVIIPPTAACNTGQPHIYNHNTPICKNLTILNNASLSCSNGELSVNGNWINNGTWNCGTGKVKFESPGLHTIGGEVTSNTFHDIEVNKPSKGVALLVKQAYITGTLKLTTGLFDISVFDIDMGSRNVTGGAADAYVRTSSTGRLQRVVSNGMVRFPIGRSYYNAAALTNAGVTDLFSIRVVDNVTDNGTEDGPTTSYAVVARTWFIDEDVTGGSDVDLRLYWNAATDYNEERNGYDHNKAYIAHYAFEMEKWENKGGETPDGPVFCRQNGITSFSPFTISSDPYFTNNDALPVVLKSTSYVCEETSTTYSWSTASEHNSDFYRLLVSEDGLNWRDYSTVKAAGFSQSELNYNQSIPSIFKFIQLIQYDFDGTSEILATTSLICDHSEVIIHPNPTTGVLNIQVIVGETSDLYYRIMDINGAEVEKDLVTVSNGNFNLRKDLSSLSSGVYIVELTIGNKVTFHRIVKN